MNATQAKKIQIKDFLHSIGIEPKRITGYDYWYLSPIRQEKEPSFKVNNLKNMWFDYGFGIGGNIIDLVIKLNECSVSDSLKILAGTLKIQPKVKEEQNISFFHQQNNVSNLLVKELKNIALLDYLEDRGIDYQVAQTYCKEVSYSIKDKNYFGIGFKNDSGGYEVRNKYAKINLLGKDITSIMNNSDEVNVYEGFIDFLSNIIINPDEKLKSNIILNGLGLIQTLIDKLKNFDKINIYFDNDTAGKNATSYLMNIFNNAKDCSKFYSDFKDINDYLLVKKEIDGILSV